ncbi:hypothetical protein E4T42_02024 [Aureobasidium subglaciale]|nr:hypothetical protein E4T42_02024 [Aureobasidium subglaciale]
MADVRSLLRNERVSRRINHPHANYSDSGKLLCAVCNLHIKTESLWEKHISSPQHIARLEHLRANPPPAPTQTKKRKAGESDDEGRKRVKAVPGGFVPEGFFDASEEGADEVEEGVEDVDTAPGPSTPAITIADSQPVVPAPPPAPDVNEDEWAAFEREMAAEQHTALPIISASATISAAPVTAEELAAQAREEQNAKRTAREIEMEADNEDAALALQQEFDDMEELDERVRRLREKREALRLAKQQDTLPDAPAPIQEPPQQDTKVTRDDKEEEDDDDDDDEDEFDDWTFGARYEDDHDIPPLGTLIDDDYPPPNPFDCEDHECQECFPQFFPATTSIGNTTAQQTMSALTEVTREKTASLKAALAAHADFITTRWRKKSRDKRFRFLEENSTLYPKKWAAIHLLNAVNYPLSEEEHVYHTGPTPDVFAHCLQTGERKAVRRVPHPRDPEGVAKRF